jgi:phage I-like protein
MPGMPRKTSSLVVHGVAIAALAVDLSAAEPGRGVRLIPAGQFRSSVDGRPPECAAWEMLDEDGERIIAEANARVSAYVIDYDHQTLRARENGKEAPAAGWFKSLEWRPGDGLYMTDPDWTSLAAQRIEDREFRYISPVFSYDKKTGRVLQLYQAALTNFPAVDGLTDLAALAADIFSSTPTS